MLKCLLVLVTAFCVVMPNFSYSKANERIRESTILYKIKTDATPQELKRLNALVNKNNIIRKRTIKGIGVDVVKLKNIKGFEKAFSQLIMESGAVKYALPDASVPHDMVPNDPRYSQQWHHNTINSAVAWDITTGSPDLSTVKVCVLDTGVDTDHPDLYRNLLSGYNTASTLGDGETPNPDYHTTNVEAILGHGTGTAGTISAVGNNLIGVSGVVWDIGIVPVKINFDDVDSYAYYSDMIDGIRWCADQGVKVANLSYGGASYGGIADAAQYLRDRGGLLFMSAGNGGYYNDTDIFPDYSSFVAVGSTNPSNELSYFSEYGPYIDVVAPGESILTTYLDGGYYYYSGTSFSSPIAAGVAGLIYSTNPEFTPTEVENFIFSTATDLGNSGEDDTYGHGLVDAGAAVLAATDFSPNVPPIVIAVATPTTGDAPLTVDFDGSGSDDTDGIATYIWDFGDGNSSSDETVFHTYVNEGTYEATLTVTDNRGASTTSDPIVVVVEPDPHLFLAPSGLLATVNGNDVTLKWNDNSNNESGFNIQRAPKITGKYTFVNLVGVDANSTSYIDENVAAGSYKYRINTNNSDDDISEYSNEVFVKVIETLPEEPTPEEPTPDPPTLTAPVLTATVDGYDVILSWTDECPPQECTYYLEKAVKIRGAIDFGFIASETVPSYSDMDVDAGTYYYRVYIETEGDSPDYSNTASARIK